MIQIHKFSVLFVFVMALSAISVQGHKCGDTGKDYFCDKTLAEIHIIMTHNSLSDRGIADNQKWKLDEQFREGVRGFNFDMKFWQGTGIRGNRPPPRLWTCHGIEGCYDPTDAITDLVEELNKPENRDEIIVIQVQNGNGVNDDECMTDVQLDMFLDLFGDLLIDDDTDNLWNNLDGAIERNKRVYLTTDRCWDTNKNFFKSGSYIGENDYEWSDCTALRRNNRKEMKTTCRDDTECTSTIIPNVLLMNSFCSFVFPSPRRARHANQKCRLLYNAQRYKDSGNFKFKTGVWENKYPNIIMVDFVNQPDNGKDVFEAQKCLRDGKVGDKGAGCELCDKMGKEI